MAVTNVDIEKYLELATFAKHLPKRDLQLAYDSEADVMYVDFGKEIKSAADSEHIDNDVIIRYDNQDEIVGLIILHASKRQKDSNSIYL